jgi:broad specificity phosphatase PhoE
MNFSTLTLSERERLAYAEGYAETAALLAEMADLETERDKLQERLDEVEFDFGELEGKYNDLIEERDELEDVEHRVRAALMLAFEVLEDIDDVQAQSVATHLREVLA